MPKITQAILVWGHESSQLKQQRPADIRHEAIRVGNPQELEPTLAPISGLLVLILLKLPNPVRRHKCAKLIDL